MGFFSKLKKFIPKEVRRPIEAVVKQTVRQAIPLPLRPFVSAAARGVRIGGGRRPPVMAEAVAPMAMEEGRDVSLMRIAGSIGGTVAGRGLTRLAGHSQRARARRIAGSAAAPVGTGLAATAARIGGGLLRGGVRTLGLAPGMVGMPRRRRRRGISGAELRGFKKVSRLLADFGMRPRGMGGARAMRRGRGFSRRRFGDLGDDGGEE